MTQILMPALSPTMEEGKLAKWLMKIGDTIRAGDIIAEVETDKATMEVEAPHAGVLDAILVPAGSEGVLINTPIALLKATAQALGSLSRPIEHDAPTVVAEQPYPAPPDHRDRDFQVLASPLARRIAVHAGLDLNGVDGSGPGGRIVKADVEKALGRPAAPAGAATLVATLPIASATEVASLEQMGIRPGSYSLAPLDSMRRTIARRMTDSFRDLPHFPLTIDIELDALLAARTHLNQRLQASLEKVSVNDLIIKAAAQALTTVPEANASYSPQGLAMHHDADIAVAVAVEGGLITPIIRGAQFKNVRAIATEMKDLVRRAREKRLRPEEFQGGTFSISNLGMFGIKSFSSILNEPQGAIMSVGAADPRPVVRDGALAIATTMTLTLTCDHRALDGAIGARFLAAFKSTIEEPLLLI